MNRRRGANADARQAHHEADNAGQTLDVSGYGGEFLIPNLDSL